MQDDDHPYMVWYYGITLPFIIDPCYSDPIRFTLSTPLVHEMAQLCGVHNRLQVVLHETSELHLLVLEIDEVLVTQMRHLDLSQFIDLSNVEIPRSEARSIKKRGHMPVTGGSESSVEADLSQSGADGDITEGRVLEESSQPRVVDPQPYIPRA